MYSTETEPYIESVKHGLEHWIPKNGQIYRSLEFASNPGGFVCDPQKIVAGRIFHQGASGGDR